MANQRITFNGIGEPDIIPTVTLPKNSKILDCSMDVTGIFSQYEYLATFDNSDEGFAVETEQPISTVRWDDVNGNVYFNSNRYDSANEMFTRSLPNTITDESGDWELSARTMITERTILSYTFPLLMSNSGNTMVESPNSIYFYWYHGNPSGIPKIYDSIGAIYHDASGVRRTLFSLEHLSLNTEYQLKGTYIDNVLTMYIMDENNIILSSGSYTIGTNPGDGFTIGKLGVSSDGTNHNSLTYSVKGWTDDILLAGPWNSYPRDIAFNVGNDATTEWAYIEELNTTITISDSNSSQQFTEVLQYYLDTSTTESVDIPLALFSSVFGLIELSNLRISYIPQPSIISNNISYNDNVGIELRNSSPIISDNYINSNCVGVGIYDSSSPTVDNNNIAPPTNYMLGICGIDIKNSNGPIIQNNTLYGHVESTGIYCIDSTNISIEDNLFNNLRTSIYMYGSNAGEICKNQFETGKTAIWMSNSNCDIINNTVNTEHGIFVYRSDVLIHNNIVNVTGDINPEIGISTSGGSAIISSNTLTGSGRGSGIFIGNLVYSYSDVTVEHNTVNGFDYGIDLRASSTSTIYNNTFYSNNLDGIYTGGYMANHGSQPVYTITNCEIYDNGGWGMNFVGNKPLNSGVHGQEILDSNTIYNNGYGQIHQSWNVEVKVIDDPMTGHGLGGVDVSVWEKDVPITDSPYITVITEPYDWTPEFNLIEYEIPNNVTVVIEDYIHTPHKFYAYDPATGAESSLDYYEMNMNRRIVMEVTQP